MNELHLLEPDCNHLRDFLHSVNEIKHVELPTINLQTIFEYHSL